MARDWATHGRDLAEAVMAPVAARSRAFAARFLRPQGREVSSTDQWVTAVEALAATPVPAVATPLSVHTRGGFMVSGLEAVCLTPVGRGLLRDPSEAVEMKARRRRLRWQHRNNRHARFQEKWRKLRLFIRSREYRQDKLTRLLGRPHS